MPVESPPIEAVPTNIITGFLGVGKTTAILHLLKQKPAHERWAVLVNEFGEIGVDGSLLSGHHPEQSGVYVREVPGGCMCCAAGLPMQFALNHLLSTARPDRLLIEPTGLGHPKEVLAVLSAPHYKKVIDLQRTLTLVDARKLRDERYTSHETFNQQIELADVIVGAKVDLYEPGDPDTLNAYARQKGRSQVQVVFAEHGRIDGSLLEGRTSLATEPDSHHHHPPEKPIAADLPLPPEGYLRAENSGEGFNSIGWRFSADKVFRHQALLPVLTGLDVERMKAVFITDEGIFGYNLSDESLTEVALDECAESRIELISRVLDDSLEARLLECLIGSS